MEFFFEESYHRREVEIWAIDQRGNEDVNFHIEDGQIIATTNPRNGFVDKDLKPLLKIPMNVLNELLPALIEYGKKKNIKTETEHHLEGKLSATSYHLEDMRNIAMTLLNTKQETDAT